jgi:uracil-DNA glycosylase family 4
MPRDSLAAIAREVTSCVLCPRLVAHRESVARNPPRRHRGERYWGRPVPGFGDPAARLLVVGLAPAANGGNRTGRIFTGDSSGDFLFAALHRARFANQALSVSKDDGLRLHDCYVSAAARCAPPDNKPTREEFARCRPYLARELVALPRLRAVLALGSLAWDGFLRALGEAGAPVPRPWPKFAHGARAELAGPRGAPLVLLGSYHVSRQNTNTGRLTPPMLDAVLLDARRAL